MGEIQCLVNNAFAFTSKGLDATSADWDRVLKAGPIAYAVMAQCVAGPMKQQGGGAIVNVSSISAFIAQPQRWTYNAAKGAVHTLTKRMALDLSPYGIRVDSISPGWIWTRENDKQLVVIALDGNLSGDNSTCSSGAESLWNAPPLFSAY